MRFIAPTNRWIIFPRASIAAGVFRTYLYALSMPILFPLPPLEFLLPLDQRPYLDRRHGSRRIVGHVAARR
jgi:hypothetical protein